MMYPDFESQSEIGFVIGNGESRAGFDLEQLRKLGPIYGCNGLYREFTPDLLVAGDSPMVDEIRKHYKHNFFRTLMASHLELPINNPRYEVKLPSLQPNQNWYAGVVAAWLMCHINKNLKTVYLIGFDLYGKGRNNKYVNNLYKGSQNYAPADFGHEPMLNTNKHITSLNELVFKQFKHIRFIRVGNKNDPFPEEWKGSIEFIDYKEL